MGSVASVPAEGGGLGNKIEQPKLKREKSQESTCFSSALSEKSQLSSYDPLLQGAKGKRVLGQSSHPSGVPAARTPSPPRLAAGAARGGREGCQGAGSQNEAPAKARSSKESFGLASARERSEESSPASHQPSMVHSGGCSRDVNIPGPLHGEG